MTPLHDADVGDVAATRGSTRSRRAGGLQPLPPETIDARAGAPAG